MPKTNPIGTGTANLVLNAPVDWRSELGRAAFQAGTSMGEFLRRLLLRGAELENPELAARLRQIRRQYYGAALVAVFAAGMVACWLSGDDQTLVRRSTRTRVREENSEFCTPQSALAS